MESSAEALGIGRLTKDGALFGYVAVDSQQWFYSQRKGLGVRRWSGTQRRYRLDLLDEWDEGFLEAEDEADLAAGRFRFKGAVLAYEELVGAEKDAVFSQRFSDWK